jgi:hypothetical protein
VTKNGKDRRFKIKRNEFHFTLSSAQEREVGGGGHRIDPGVYTFFVARTGMK